MWEYVNIVFGNRPHWFIFLYIHFAFQFYRGLEIFGPAQRADVPDALGIDPRGGPPILPFLNGGLLGF